jgi:hypothetical protein
LISWPISRGIGAALGQRTHFGGDNREALAGVASTGSLDPCIEREEIGLEGDAINHADDLGDALCGGLDRVHRLDRAFDDRAASCRLAMRVRSGAVDLGGTCGAFADQRGDLLHCCAGFLEPGGLSFGAQRKIIGGGADFARAAVDRAA